MNDNKEDVVEMHVKFWEPYAVEMAAIVLFISVTSFCKKRAGLHRRVLVIQLSVLSSLLVGLPSRLLMYSSKSLNFLGCSRTGLSLEP